MGGPSMPCFTDGLHGGSPSKRRVRRLWSTRVYRTRADQSRISRSQNVSSDIFLHQHFLSGRTNSFIYFSSFLLFYSLPQHNLVSPLAGEIWFSSSVLVGLLLFGLAVFFFTFGLLPYWFKVHKHLSEILGCQCASLSPLLFMPQILTLRDFVSS